MNRKQPLNLLELVPERQVRWEESDQGDVILFVPKFHHPWLVRRLLPLLARPYLQVHLDKMGSHLWRQCDGRSSVRQLAEDLSGRFAQPLEPLLNRMARFFRQLESEKVMILKKKEESDAQRIGNQAADY